MRENLLIDNIYHKNEEMHENLLTDNIYHKN